MTAESFKAWKAAFDKENAELKAREEEERLRALTPKEREEYKKVAVRLNGGFNVLCARIVQLNSESLVQDANYLNVTGT